MQATTSPNAGTASQLLDSSLPHQSPSGMCGMHYNLHAIDTATSFGPAAAISENGPTIFQSCFQFLLLPVELQIKAVQGLSLAELFNLTRVGIYSLVVPSLYLFRPAANAITWPKLHDNSGWAPRISISFLCPLVTPVLIQCHLTASHL